MSNNFTSVSTENSGTVRVTYSAPACVASFFEVVQSLMDSLTGDVRHEPTEGGLVTNTGRASGFGGVSAHPTRADFPVEPFTV